jgi:hypothetical protein
MKRAFRDRSEVPTFHTPCASGCRVVTRSPVALGRRSGAGHLAVLNSIWASCDLQQSAPALLAEGRRYRAKSQLQAAEADEFSMRTDRR